MSESVTDISNSIFSENHEDNKNDQDNENYPDKKNEDNYPVNKYMFKVNNRKSFLVSLWLTLSIFAYFTPCSCVFNVDFEHVIVR